MNAKRQAAKVAAKANRAASLEKARERQRVVLIIKDTEKGKGQIDVDLFFEPTVEGRTTNSPAINTGFRLKAIIEKHWDYLSSPITPDREGKIKSSIILPPNFTDSTNGH